MLVIGLTGGIGSGKSTVAGYFRELAAPVIDTDEIARLLVSPGQTAYNDIIDYFGIGFLNLDRTLNRELLRQHIFNNVTDKLWLENLLHPLISAEIKRQIDQVQASYCIVVIPLLIETGYKLYIDRILVVDAPDQLQIERTMERDQVPLHEVEAVIQQQTSREHRLAKADDVITNDKDLAVLQEKVAKLHQYYLQHSLH